MLNISEKDKQVLREVGKQYMELASLSIHKEKMELWKSFNRGDNKRAMVVIDQHPWNELNNLGELTLYVENPIFRELEYKLKRDMYSFRHFPVDMVLEPYITIPKAITGMGMGLKCHAERLGETGTTAMSQHFTNVLEDEDDLEKLKDMDIKEDVAESLARFEAAKDIFDGIAPVIMGHGVGFHLGVWDRLSEYMGLENIFCDIYDRPEFLHACMRRITDSTIAGIKQANEQKLHDDIVNTCHCSYIYNDKTLSDFGAGLGTTSDNCWAFGLAQLFTSASPAVTEEFEIPYISEMAQYFDSIYYGCCDRLDDRMGLILQIPKVKKISCSPWNDKEKFFKSLEGTGKILSNKPNPAFLSAGYDETIIRNDIRETLELSKKYNVATEFILKDISTVQNCPERLTKWGEIAMEEVNR